MNMKILVWCTIILLVISILTTWYFKIFEPQAFYGMFIIAMAYIAGYIYLVLSKRSDDAAANTVKTLDYCWKKAGEVLQRMPGGTSIEWAQGKGRRGEMRVFYENNKRRSYRALYGISSITKRPVVVIFDMDQDDIARYNSNPSPEVLEDPFAGFKPFYNPMAENMMKQRMMMMRGGKRGRRGMGGLTINYGEGGGFGGDMTEPDDDIVDSALPGDEER